MTINIAIWDNPLWVRRILIGTVSVCIIATLALLILLPITFFHVNEVELLKESQVSLLEAYIAENHRVHNILLMNITILIVVCLVLLIVSSISIWHWIEIKSINSSIQKRGVFFNYIEVSEEGRIKIDDIELSLNRCQVQTFLQLIHAHQSGKILHAIDINKENGAIMIKRLREELGARLLEKLFIVSQYGVGYRLNIAKDAQIIIPIPPP